MRTRYSKRFVAAVAFSDLSAITMAFFAAYEIRFFTFFSAPLGIPPLAKYASALWLVLLVFLSLFREARLYHPTQRIRRIEELFLVIKTVTYAVVILTALTFFYRGYEGSRLFLFLFWVTACTLISLGRYVLIEWGYIRRSRNKDPIEVLFIGGNQNIESLIAWAKDNPHYGIHPVGILASEIHRIGQAILGVPIIGLTEHWETFLEKLRPAQVILLDPGFTREKITDLASACEDLLIDFKMGVDIHGLIFNNVAVEYMSQIPLLGFRALPLDDPWNRFLKRTLDLLIAGCMAILSLPVGILIAILIRCEGPGPIFYAQERIGRDGKTFRILKFRTMKVDAEKETGPVWAKPQDDRRTRTGEFLRRWNLDEFPQLLNVLSGEMSLVGPRPERPHFVDQFRESVPRYMARHKIKSGLTGWAQVHGLRGDTSIEERIKYDLYYMENWSLLLDIEILIMTAFAFKNAY